MPNIGVKHLLRDEIIAALKTSPCGDLLNTVDGDGVYPSERLETQDGYAVSITPAILVEMPTQVGAESYGPATTLYTSDVSCYLYFSDQSDIDADEFASLVMSAVRVSLAANSYTSNMRLIGGFRNCFEVNEVGFGELGQDKVFAFTISFSSGMNTVSMVNIP